MTVTLWNETPTRDSGRLWNEPALELRVPPTLRVDAIGSFAAAVVCSVVLFWLLMAVPAWREIETGISAWYTDDVTAYQLDQTAPGGRLP
jgi:hypothetical protein